VTTSPILVAGAGIAGLVTALCLARRGHAVVIFEKRRNASELGAGLQLSPNATHVLEALGLGTLIARRGTAPTHLTVRRMADGGHLGGMRMNGENREGSPPFLSVMRADLHAILLAACRAESRITLVTDAEVTGVETTAAGVRPIVAGSGDPSTAAVRLLVGADGVRSAVRRVAVDRDSPVFAGLEACRTLVPAAGQPGAALEPAINLWLGQGMHVVHYPVDEGRLINLVLIRKAAEAREGWSRPGDRAGIQALASGMAPLLAGLVRAAEDWQVWSLHDREPGRAITGESIALVGDAAHPMLPFLAQGASMAIEDAAVLATLLPPPRQLDREGTERALALYAKARGARVARTVRTARGNARLYHLGMPGALARDLAMSILGEAGMRSRHEWLYDWRLSPTALAGLARLDA
jgi:salicylate hydroxylase